MRLINAETLKLENFFGKPAPQYAILSHTWGDDEDEVSFIDIQGDDAKQGKKGYFKIKESCKQSRKDGLGYVWIDTCCINKDSDRELSEAINSMFRWYQKASVCYAYLADVPLGDRDDLWHPDSKFCLSRWFRRGWTLQELLAPSKLHFYDERWTSLGTKTKLSGLLQRITGIPRPFLEGFAKMRDASVAQRMSWAARRDTKREEDLSYCLLGVFDIAMPMIYGEGGDKAFRRLQQGIMEQTRDHSILAWHLNQAAAMPIQPSASVSGGALARAPSDFANCANIVTRNGGNSTIQVSGGYLRAHLPVYESYDGYIYGLLDCGPEKNAKHIVGIPLRPTMSGENSNEYIRPRGHSSLLFPGTVLDVSPSSVCIQVDRGSQVDRENWFYIEEYDQSIMDLVEVHPHTRWQEDRVTIATENRSDGKSQLSFARFRTNRDRSADFVVVLEYGQLIQTQCHIMVISRDTSLEELSQRLVYMRQSALGFHSASNGQCHLEVTITPELVVGKPMFVVRLFTTHNPPENTFDATSELQQLDMKFDFVDVLLEQDNVCPQAQYLEKQLGEKAIALESMKSRLEVVEDSLKRLVVEKRRLVANMGTTNQEVQSLIMAQNEIKDQQDELSKRESKIQLDLDKVRGFHIKVAWLETMVKVLLDSGQIQVDLSNIGTNVCKRIPSMAALPSGDTKNRLTPLLWATRHQRQAILKKLLEDGADTESQDTNGLAPLADAASLGCDDIVRLLLDSGANIEMASSDGRTPLAHAAASGHVSIVKLLLENGANMEHRDTLGSTPIARAAAAGHGAVVRLLLGKGADIQSKDKSGRTPFSRAVTNRHDSIADMLEQRI